MKIIYYCINVIFLGCLNDIVVIEKNNVVLWEYLAFRNELSWCLPLIFN